MKVCLILNGYRVKVVGMWRLKMLGFWLCGWVKGGSTQKEGGG